MEWDRDFVTGARSALKVIEKITQKSGPRWRWPSGHVVLEKGWSGPSTLLNRRQSFLLTHWVFQLKLPSSFEATRLIEYMWKFLVIQASWTSNHIPFHELHDEARHLVRLKSGKIQVPSQPSEMPTDGASKSSCMHRRSMTSGTITTCARSTSMALHLKTLVKMVLS